MRLVVHQSKIFAAVFCAIAIGITAVIFHFGDGGGFPPFFKWFSAGITVLMFAVTAKNFVWAKPIVTADESGIRDTRIGWEVVPWGSIRAYRHAPRVYRLANGKKAYMPSNAWRPVQLWIEAPETTVFSMIRMFSRSTVHPDFPDALYLEISFAGLDTPSIRLVEKIRELAPNAKEEAS